MSAPSIKPIFGGAILGTTPTFPTEASVLDVYRRLEEGGCTTIDTTHDWPDAEAWLGKTKAGTRFTIDSKTPGGIVPGQSTAEGIVRQAGELAGHVGVGNVDIYNIHAPDPTIPLEETLRGMNDAYEAGLFKRFGLSNFTAAQVEEVHAICTAKGWVKPTAFQGNYNPVARRPDKELLPTLRRLGIAFYAYSAMAGGFLTKTREQIEERGADARRFGGEGIATDMYRSLYVKPVYMRALELWAEAAELAGCGRAELAYRWVGCDSALRNEYGDGIIFGASKAEHVSQTLAWLKKGSLGEEVCRKIDEIWDLVKDEAPVDNYHSFFKEHAGSVDVREVIARRHAS